MADIQSGLQRNEVARRQLAQLARRGSEAHNEASGRHAACGCIEPARDREACAGRWQSREWLPMRTPIALDREGPACRAPTELREIFSR